MIRSKFQNCATKIKANNKVRQSQFIWVAAKSKGTESNRKTEKKPRNISVYAFIFAMHLLSALLFFMFVVQNIFKCFVMFWLLFFFCPVLTGKSKWSHVTYFSLCLALWAELDDVITEWQRKWMGPLFCHHWLPSLLNLRSKCPISHTLLLTISIK